VLLLGPLVRGEDLRQITTLRWSIVSHGARLRPCPYRSKAGNLHDCPGLPHGVSQSYGGSPESSLASWEREQTSSLR
jgi:hypothetical protein